MTCGNNQFGPRMMAAVPAGSGFGLGRLTRIVRVFAQSRSQEIGLWTLEIDRFVVWIFEQGARAKLHAYMRVNLAWWGYQDSRRSLDRMIYTSLPMQPK